MSYANLLHSPHITMAGHMTGSMHCIGEAMSCLQGSLPDMTATTALYLNLQRIYREQADRDISAVTRHVQDVLSSIDREPGSIPASEIRMFCKHVRYLR